MPVAHDQTDRLDASSSAVSPPRRSVWLILTLAIALYGFGLNLWHFHEYVFDDAYITLRYAQNLSRGECFCFNPGERILGTTTPLYTLLLALVGALGADLEWASAILFCAALAAAGALGGLLIGRFGSPVFGLLFCLWMALGFGRVLAFFRMEMPLYALLLIGALWLAIAGREALSGTVAGLAVLTRYDAVLFVGVMVMALALRHRRLPWRWSVSLGAVTLPWFVFAQLYFGSVLPNTLGAKRSTETFWSYLGYSAVEQMRGFNPLYRITEAASTPTWSAVFVVVVLIALPFRVATLLERDNLLLVPMLFPVALWLGYSVIGPPLGFYWYLYPASLLLLVVCLIAWASVTSRRRVEPAVTAALLVVVLLGCLWAPQRARAQKSFITERGVYRARQLAYREQAQWLKRYGLTDLEVATHEPGYLAYLSEVSVLDMAGLVSRELRYHGPREGRSSFTAVVAERQPGLFVPYPGEVPGVSLLSYVNAHQTFPSRSLQLNPGVFAQRFDALANQWLASVPATADLLQHPLADELDDPQDWTRRGGLTLYTYQRVTDGIQRTYAATTRRYSPWEGAETPTFLIDFDELAFRFQATQPRNTVVQLIVDGQAVLERGGRPNSPLREIAWPVLGWRGRQATLRFVDVAQNGHFLRAGAVESRRYQTKTLIDDFESQVWNERWQSVWSPGPTRLRAVAREYGRLALLVGEAAATSFGLDGSVELRSHPFRVEHEAIAFLAFDFGTNTVVELVTGGEVVRSLLGTNRRRLRPSVWDLDDLQGREVVLVVRDDNPEPRSWIGIDEIYFFDR